MNLEQVITGLISRIYIGINVYMCMYMYIYIYISGYKLTCNNHEFHRV